MVERWGSEAEAAGPGNSFLLFFALFTLHCCVPGVHMCFVVCVYDW